MLGREDHVGRAEQRVGPGREDLDLRALVLLHREDDVRPHAAPDPVALHELDRVGPVEEVEIREQPVRVRRDREDPLLERALEDGMVAAVAAPVGRDLLVGEDGAERRTPVDERLFAVRETERVDDLAPRELVELRPRAAVGVGLADGLTGPRVELGHQLGDRAGPVGDVVVPGIEDPQEDPLRPAVVGDVGGGHAAARIVAEPEGPQLAPHVGDVRLGRDLRVAAGLDGVLLGRETERVVAHRVQDVATLHPREAREDVGADVAERVADVETGAARVREHVEDVELLPPLGALEPVAQGPARVGRPEGPLLLPVVLPARLDLVGEARRVAVARRGVGVAHRRRAYRHW